MYIMCVNVYAQPFSFEGSIWHLVLHIFMVAEPVLLPPSLALGAPPLLSSLLDKPPGKETINGSPRLGE